eukprot:1159277-Pelagomonas_calceolata.AAC.1
MCEEPRHHTHTHTRTGRLGLRSCRAGCVQLLQRSGWQWGPHGGVACRPTCSVRRAACCGCTGR